MLAVTDVVPGIHREVKRNAGHANIGKPDFRMVVIVQTEGAVEGDRVARRRHVVHYGPDLVAVTIRYEVFPKSWVVFEITGD